MNKIILDPETKRFIDTGIYKPTYERYDCKKYDWSDIGKLYLEDKLSQPQIAKLKGSSLHAVRYAIKKAGFLKRNKSETNRILADKGIFSYKDEKNPNWKGGRRIRPDGYIQIRLNLKNPYYSMASKQEYVLEHRLVMAEYLGRCLSSWEVVHHKNGIKNDNRLENLELLPTIKDHLVDIKTKQYIKTLEQRVTKLEEKSREQNKEIRLLKWQLKQKEEQNAGTT